ncbi:MAG: O-antigen ligase family protein [Rubrivivax sp.]|nr:O-antigen ligase family protein [Rubrivivax sp.]
MIFSFAALVLLAVLSKELGNQVFTPLSVVLAAGLYLLRLALDAPRRRAVEIFLLQFGVLIYALANQEPSYLEHAALVVCLLPTLGRLRAIGRTALGEGSILIVLLYVLWSATWTSNLDMSLAGFAMSALCLAFLLAFVLQFEGEWDAVFSHVLVVLAAIWLGSLAAGAMGIGSAGRTFAGVTLHRNHLGFLLGLMILLCLFNARFHFSWRAVAGAVAAAALLVYIDSKSSIIAIVATALLLWVVSARRWKLYMGVLALGVAVFVTALPSPKWDHFALWMGRDPTFTSRTEIWAGSIGLASEQPLTGYGYNAVWSAHENRLAQYPDAPGPRYAHAHNAWIDWVLQLGLGGLAVYLLFLGVLLRRAWHRGRTPGGLPVAIQAGCLLSYIQIYDLANVSTVPVTRFGFFMLAAASLSLWLGAQAEQRERLRWTLQGADASAGANDIGPGTRPPRRRWAQALALLLAGFAAVAAYAIWEDGQRFAATERRGKPAPNGVADAGYLDPREFQWKGVKALDDYARRHRQALLETMKRSESP